MEAEIFELKRISNGVLFARLDNQGEEAEAVCFQEPDEEGPIQAYVQAFAHFLQRIANTYVGAEGKYTIAVKVTEDKNFKSKSLIDRFADGVKAIADAFPSELKLDTSTRQYTPEEEAGTSEDVPPRGTSIHGDADSSPPEKPDVSKHESAHTVKDGICQAVNPVFFGQKPFLAVGEEAKFQVFGADRRVRVKKPGGNALVMPMEQFQRDFVRIKPDTTETKSRKLEGGYARCIKAFSHSPKGQASVGDLVQYGQQHDGVDVMFPNKWLCNISWDEFEEHFKPERSAPASKRLLREIGWSEATCTKECPIDTASALQPGDKVLWKDREGSDGNSVYISYGGAELDMHLREIPRFVLDDFFDVSAEEDEGENKPEEILMPSSGTARCIRDFRSKTHTLVTGDVVTFRVRGVNGTISIATPAFQTYVDAHTFHHHFEVTVKFQEEENKQGAKDSASKDEAPHWQAICLKQYTHPDGRQINQGDQVKFKPVSNTQAGKRITFYTVQANNQTMNINPTAFKDHFKPTFSKSEVKRLSTLVKGKEGDQQGHTVGTNQGYKMITKKTDTKTSPKPTSKKVSKSTKTRAPLKKRKHD